MAIIDRRMLSLHCCWFANCRLFEFVPEWIAAGPTKLTLQRTRQWLIAIRATIAGGAPSTVVAGAQTSPMHSTSPLPTDQLLGKQGSSRTDLVANPTIDECQKGWNPGLRLDQGAVQSILRAAKVSPVA